MALRDASRTRFRGPPGRKARRLPLVAVRGCSDGGRFHRINGADRAAPRFPGPPDAEMQIAASRW